MSLSNYLNLGCGSVFDKSWTNLDFKSNNHFVKAHDLRKGIPFPDNTFDVVYHSHLLEHFQKKEGEYLLSECKRVLKNNGILRIAVPDFEQLAKEYLKNLESALKENTSLSEAHYDWSTIELIDQMTRTRSGGEMKRYWDMNKIPDEKHVIERIGCEYLEYKKNMFKDNSTLKLKNTKRHKFKKLFSLNFYRNRLLSFLLNNEKDSFEIGRFAESGELHKWMYDRYSLTKALLKIGFRNIIVKDAFTSKIHEWEKYQFLDVIENKPRKPDSLFIEAEK